MAKSQSGNFDLNINNYKKQELEEIFDLPGNYDHAFIQLKAAKLRDNINSDTNIDKSIKDNTISFINQAKETLLKQLKNIGNFQKIAEADIYNLNYDLKPSLTQDVGMNYSIIEKKETPYTQSLPSEFYEGVINPLKKRILHKSINIDTRFRDNYYTSQSTNFHLDLPIKFSNVISLQLSAFEFPSTAYAISKQFGTNYFWVSASTVPPQDAVAEDIAIYGVVENLCIIVPNGNYSPSDLVIFLNNYIITNPQFVSSIYLKYLTFVLNIGGGSGNGGSGQIVVGISSLAPGIFNFSLNFQADIKGNPDYISPLPLKLGWLMGFREGFYENNVTYISEGIADTSGPHYMYLVIDDFNNNVNNNFYSAFNSSILNKNILARISLQSPAFYNNSQNNFNLITNPRQYFGPVDLQKMQIQLLDEYGRIINLNNMDYSFCLTMQMIYDL
jgi:hypothetical protein